MSFFKLFYLHTHTHDHHPTKTCEPRCLSTSLWFIWHCMPLKCLGLYPCWNKWLFWPRSLQHVDPCLIFLFPSPNSSSSSTSIPRNLPLMLSSSPSTLSRQVYQIMLHIYAHACATQARPRGSWTRENRKTRGCGCLLTQRLPRSRKIFKVEGSLDSKAPLSQSLVGMKRDN